MYFLFVSWLDRNSYCRHITARCSFYTCGYYSMSWVDPSSLAKLTWIHFAQHAFAHCSLLCWGSSVHFNSSTCIQLEYLYVLKCSITLVTFIIVKYPVWLKMIVLLLKVYIMHIWVPFCMNCFISRFCSCPDFCKMYEICFTEFCFSFLV